MPESLLFKVANKEPQTGEIFQETLKLKLCTPPQYLIWNGFSIEKTTAIKKSHKFHLVKPFIVRGVEPFLNFHGSALVVCGTIPDRCPSSQEAKTDLSQNSLFQPLLQGHGVLQGCFCPSGKPYCTCTYASSLRLCSSQTENGSWAFPSGMEWPASMAQRWVWWGKQDSWSTRLTIWGPAKGYLFSEGFHLSPWRSNSLF